MTAKQYREIEKKGLIRSENRQIKNITLRGNGHWKTLECFIELYPVGNRADWYNHITIPIEDIDPLVSIFCVDDEPQYENTWNLSDFNGKYVRLCWYVTPKSEMHELADEESLYAIKHITDDSNQCLFIIDPTKKRN